jgi:cysteine-rich repeat protein
VPGAGETRPGNLNACNTNPAGIPGDPSPVAALATVSTVCGNGNVEAYEECDHGAANGASGNSCSATCRCVGAFPCP